MSQQYIYGLHAVLAFLKKHQVGNKLWVLEGRHDKKVQQVIHIAQQHRIPIDRVERAKLDELCKEGNHQGVVLLANEVRPQAAAEDSLEALLEQVNSETLFLILDGVQDPHNLGACLRSAAAAGVQAVILPKNRSVAVTPTVRKVACGAAEVLAIHSVNNLARALAQLKEAGIWITGLDASAPQTIYQVDFTGPTAIVMGSEGAGIRKLTAEHCDYLANIPMTDQVESLNVSVATGITLFEAVRQRQAQ